MLVEVRSARRPGQAGAQKRIDGGERGGLTTSEQARARRLGRDDDSGAVIRADCAERTMLSDDGWRRKMRVIVVSPHLDDAVLSVGGTIRRLTRSAVEVSVVTVFAGDPDAATAVSYWDASRGQTQGAAARQRRDEDQAALGELGACALALPFADSGYVGAREPDEIWSHLRPAVDSADLVLLPGWPLTHADHHYVMMLVLERIDSEMPIVFYAEQPYASYPIKLLKGVVGDRTEAALRHAYRAGVHWRRQRLDQECREAQRRALAKYVGELENLGLRAMLAKVGHWLSGEWLGIGERMPLPAGLEQLASGRNSHASFE
jgi:LmbE family N-acetylglucosaminyl deacetylase